MHIRWLRTADTPNVVFHVNLLGHGVKMVKMQASFGIVYIDGRNTQQCFFERAAFAFGVCKRAEESMMIATTVIIYYYYRRDGMLSLLFFFVPIYYDEYI